MFTKRIIQNPLIQNMELLIVKTGGTFVYHWALKDQWYHLQHMKAHSKPSKYLIVVCLFYLVYEYLVCYYATMTTFNSLAKSYVNINSEWVCKINSKSSIWTIQNYHNSVQNFVCKYHLIAFMYRFQWFINPKYITGSKF